MQRQKLREKLEKKRDLATQQMVDHISKSWPALDALGIDKDFIIEKMHDDPTYFEKLSERARSNPDNFMKLPKSAGVLSKVEKKNEIIVNDDECELSGFDNEPSSSSPKEQSVHVSELQT